MHTSSCHHDHNHSHHGEQQQGGLHDPVCGMAVSSDSKISEQYEGQTYRFCSQKCQEKFRAEPQRYAGHQHSTDHSGHAHHAPAESVAGATEYTCPMHPEIGQSKLPVSRKKGWSEIKT